MPYYRFIDRPQYIPRKRYDEALAGIVERNKNLPGLKAIYRFGNITSPGISDLDVLFVFKKDAVSEATGFEGLPEEHKPLFTHGIMAVSENHYRENGHFTLWSNHDLLWGENDISGAEKNRTSYETEQLNIQTALEFFIANYIDLKIQKCYRVIKLRAFLQHMKGLLYDLELLHDTESTLHEPLSNLKKWMIDWFEKTPSDHEITNWITEFEPLCDNYVQATFSRYALYLPEKPEYQIAKNMILFSGHKLSYTRKGMLLPVALSGLGRTYFKLQHRLNNFTFTCPLTHTAVPIVADRYRFLTRMKTYNRKHLPNFMTITTSITAKII